jgi:hypothetical protein
MAAKERFEIPVGMRRVFRRFERWRKGHKARLPIPEVLWSAAAEAAREHGVFRAAKALRRSLMCAHLATAAQRFREGRDFDRSVVRGSIHVLLRLCS